MILCRKCPDSTVWLGLSAVPNQLSGTTCSGMATAMQRDSDSRGRGDFRRDSANDNGGPEARIVAAGIMFARLLGRRIARERLEATRAATDNAPANRSVGVWETGYRDRCDASGRRDRQTRCAGATPSRLAVSEAHRAGNSLTQTGPSEPLSMPKSSSPDGLQPGCCAAAQPSGYNSPGRLRRRHPSAACSRSRKIHIPWRCACKPTPHACGRSSSISQGTLSNSVSKRLALCGCSSPLRGRSRLRSGFGALAGFGAGFSRALVAVESRPMRPTRCSP